jgi:hypothetical protein
VGRRVRALILVAALIAVGVFAGSSLSQWWAVPGSEATAATARAVLAPRERVRVEVLNAGGRPNLAREATDLLREGGFDVVFFGNAGSFDQDSSVVLDRVGRPDLARGVADALAIRSVRSEPDSNLFVDVSVRLGGEWSAPAPVAPPEPELAWWHPRRLLKRRAAPPTPEQGGSIADPGSGR